MRNCNENSIEQRATSICNVMLEQVAEKFKTIRNQKDMSLRALSDLSDVSTAVISDLETKKYLPKLEVLIKLALALNISISELLTTLAPKEIVVELTDKLTEKQTEETIYKDFLMSFGLKGRDIVEVMNFMEFKKQQSRMKFFQ